MPGLNKRFETALRARTYCALTNLFRLTFCSSCLSFQTSVVARIVDPCTSSNMTISGSSVDHQQMLVLDYIGPFGTRQRTIRYDPYKTLPLSLKY